MRELVYKSFAKLFTYPDKELINLISSGVIIELFKVLDIPESNFLSIERWIKSFDKEENLLEELQVEYTRLFINTFPTLPAPLYKSYYEDNELLGHSIGKLIDTYEKYGFEVSKDQYELPDNLALLLEFVFRLNEINSTEKEQSNFIEEFILSWTKQLEQKIIENAEIEFYKFLIISLNSFLKEDVNQSKVKL